MENSTGRGVFAAIGVQVIEAIFMPSAFFPRSCGSPSPGGGAGKGMASRAGNVRIEERAFR